MRVDVDRYKINGELTQVMVSARELDQTNLPAVGWVNERLQYTHGYGVVFSPANNVASQGQPDFYVKGVPATTTVNELEVEQPKNLLWRISRISGICGCKLFTRRS